MWAACLGYAAAAATKFGVLDVLWLFAIAGADGESAACLSLRFLHVWGTGASIIFYAVTLPPLTTFAHVCAILMGSAVLFGTTACLTESSKTVYVYSSLNVDNEAIGPSKKASKIIS